MPSELIKKRAAVMLDVHPDRDELIREMRDMVAALQEKRAEIDFLIWEGKEVLEALETADAE